MPTQLEEITLNQNKFIFFYFTQRYYVMATIMGRIVVAVGQYISINTHYKSKSLLKKVSIFFGLLNGKRKFSPLRCPVIPHFN